MTRRRATRKNDELIVRALVRGVMNVPQLAVATLLPERSIQQELTRLMGEGYVERAGETMAVASVKLVRAYTLTDKGQRGIAGVATLKPRGKSGSGQIAGPCMSRQYQWNRGLAW